jgi:hypothetical protein
MTEADPLAGLYEVVSTTTLSQTEPILQRVFSISHNSFSIRTHRRPLDFNLLLGWFPGDERWPVAALLLKRGLTPLGPIGSYEEIAGIVGRSRDAVNTAIGSNGPKSVFSRLFNARLLMGDRSRRNELRFDLRLPSKVWVPLVQQRGVRTVAGLERSVRDGTVYDVRRVGREAIDQIGNALAAYYQ